MGEALLILGVGNEQRGDDAVGVTAARRLAALNLPGVDVRTSRGELGDLCGLLSEARQAIILDAVVSGGPPGALHRYEAHRQALPAEMFRASSHQLGLAEAIELCRALGTLPEVTLVYGVEGACFDVGAGMSPAIQAALPRLVDAVAAAARSLSTPA